MTGHEPPDALGVIVIGPREIYDAVQKVSSQMTSLIAAQAQHAVEHRMRDEQIKAEFSQVYERVDGCVERIDDHEDRIRVGERRRWPLGPAGTLLTLGALLVSVIALARSWHGG